MFLPCKSELCEEKGLKAGICTNRYSVPNAAYTYFYFLPWVLHLGSMVRAVRKGRRRWEVKVIECRGANGLDPLRVATDSQFEKKNAIICEAL